MTIRYDQAFNREIARTVKNFNRKLRRLESLDHTLLPERVLVSDLKKEFTQRSDLKRKLRELQDFSRKGAENVITIGNLTTTEYQFEIEKREAARVKSALTRQIHQVEQSNGGYNALKSDYLQNLQYRRQFLNIPIKRLTRSQILTRRKIISQESNSYERQQQFYDNMFSMLFRSAYQAGINQDDILPVLNDLRKLTPYELAEAVELHAPLKDLLDKYHIYTGVGIGLDDSRVDLVTSVSNLKEALPSILKYYNK